MKLGGIYFNNPLPWKDKTTFYFWWAKRLNRVGIKLQDLAKECRIKAYGVRNCAYCGEAITILNFTRDHVKPVVAGGTRNDGNILIACNSCNQIKSCFHLEVFRKYTIGKSALFFFESGRPIEVKRQTIKPKLKIKSFY